MIKNYKKLAFTLAEVLIVIGIIGIVAAITIPTLITNYQKKVWVVQLKKNANFVTNSLRQVIAMENVSNLCESSVAYCNSYSKDVNVYLVGESYGKLLRLSEAPETSEFSQAVCSQQNACGKASPNGEKWVKPFMLNDGSCVAPITLGYGEDYIASYGFIVDVNCDKKPNVWGYDRFAIQFNEHGAIIPAGNGSADDAELAEALEPYCGKKLAEEDGLSGIDGLIGSVCYEKIKKDGWKINY